MGVKGAQKEQVVQNRNTPICRPTARGNTRRLGAPVAPKWSSRSPIESRHDVWFFCDVQDSIQNDGRRLDLLYIANLIDPSRFEAGDVSSVNFRQL